MEPSEEIGDFEQRRRQNIAELNVLRVQLGIKPQDENDPRFKDPVQGRGRMKTIKPPPTGQTRRAKRQQEASPDYAPSKPVNEPVSTRQLRERRNVVNYSAFLEDEAKMDEYIFCDICQTEYVHGCSEHQPTFSPAPESFNIVTSGIKNAGLGVFNTGKETIPVGKMFGPYQGKLIPAYKFDKNKQESGYAWEIRDFEKKRIIGFVDPGTDPDPDKTKNNWLSRVNSANYRHDQNIMGTQYKGKIYYRVCKPIGPGVEFFTYYGDKYARKMGVNPKIFQHGTRWPEHWDGKKKIYFCPKEGCVGAFPSQFTLDTHVRIGGCQWKRKTKNDDNPDRPEFPCQSCERKFNSSSALKFHVESVHEGKKFPCEICGYEFTQKGHLNTHIRTIHEKSERYICVTCGKDFPRNGHLQTHIKTVHDGEKRFPCESCDKRFGKNSHLTHHIKTVHLKEKKFKCETCGAAFGELGTLNRHISRFHTKDFPLKCEMCAKGFVRPDKLRNHKLTAHGIDLKKIEEENRIFKCKTCPNRFLTEDGLRMHKQQVHMQKKQGI